MGYYSSRSYVMKRWASKTNGTYCSPLASYVLKQIENDPFGEFSEHKEKFLEIMKEKEGGLSPSVKRATFIAVAMKEKVVTEQSLKGVFKVMNSVFNEDPEKEKRLRDHALDLLIEIWNRSEELEKIW